MTKPRPQKTTEPLKAERIQEPLKAERIQEPLKAERIQAPLKAERIQNRLQWVHRQQEKMPEFARALGKEKLQKRLSQLPEWEVSDGKLVRRWVHQSLPELELRLCKILDRCRPLGELPTVELEKLKVRVFIDLFEGGGPTEVDVEIAELVEGVG